MVEDLAGVRRSLDRACQRIIVASGDALDECSHDLDAALRQLAECQSRLGPHAGDPAALEESWRVRRSFQRARSLLPSAAAYHAGWSRVRGAMSGGYTRSGDPAPLRHTSRLCLQA